MFAICWNFFFVFLIWFLFLFIANCITCSTLYYCYIIIKLYWVLFLFTKVQIIIFDEIVGCKTATATFWMRGPSWVLHYLFVSTDDFIDVLRWTEFWCVWRVFCFMIRKNSPKLQENCGNFLEMQIPKMNNLLFL